MSLTQEVKFRVFLFKPSGGNGNSHFPVGTNEHVAVLYFYFVLLKEITEAVNGELKTAVKEGITEIMTERRT